ncbi:MAG: DUF3619 family protein [Candidatus Thiodiazotropha sp.]
MKPDEQAFTSKAKQYLDEHINHMDPLTAARLQAARKQALESRPRRAFGWLPVSTFAAAAAALIAVALWHQGNTLVSPQFNEDWELLASGEELELIEELEFYNWLELMHGES